MPRSGYRRAFTTPETDVPLRPDSVFHFPESMFHLLRIPCSTSSGFGVPLPPAYAEGLVDRSSRPHRQPRATPTHIVTRITALRLQRQPGIQIARTVGVSPATVSRVLRRAGLHRLDALEPAPPVRRYERDHPGELLHLDVKKLARFQQPGHRVTGNRRQCSPGAGWDYVHVLRRRPLPRRLRPDPSRRDRRQCHRLPPGRRRPLPPARRRRHGGDDRQRRRIPLARLPAALHPPSGCAISTRDPIRPAPTARRSASFKPPSANGPTPAHTERHASAPHT